MNIRSIPAAEVQRWEAYVESCPKTVAWQSYRWSEAVQGNYDAEFYPLAAEENGAIRGVLPLYRMSGPKPASHLVSVPFAVAGGIAADDDSAAQVLIDGAVELSRRLGAAGFTLKQYRHPAPGPLKADTHYFNRELALGADEASIWKQLDPRNRRAIEAAEKDRFDLEYPSDSIGVFYDLLLGFLTRSGVPCPSQHWIRTLLDLKMYGIALLRRNDDVVAGTMVKTFRSTVSFPYSCLKRGRSTPLDAMYWLYWQLIRQFGSKGFRIFHSGRMPESEDVESYRLGWGGEKHPYFYQYYPETQRRTEYSTKRGWKRSLLTTAWKRMPKCLVKTVGPKIVARFP